MSSDRKLPDDRELEDFLAGKHPVGRAYREASENQTAPRELDDAILRMAREHAAQSKAETVAPIRRRPRWLQPLAVAATLALSLGVLMNIWRDPSLRDQVAPEHEVAPAATAPPSPAPAKVQAPIVQSERVEESVASEARRAAPPPSPPPAAEPRRAQPFPKEKARAAGPEGDDALADEVSPSAVGPRAGRTMAPAAPPPPPAAASAPSDGAAPASRPDIDPRYSFGDAAPVQGKKEMQVDEREQAQKALAAEAAAAQSQSIRQEPETPEVLIERARAAIARDDVEAARRAVAELRRRFPDAPLPEDLRPLASPATPDPP